MVASSLEERTRLFVHDFVFIASHAEVSESALSHPHAPLVGAYSELEEALMYYTAW